MAKLPFCLCGVRGGDLAQRIEAILTVPRLARLTRARRIALMLGALAFVAAPVVVGALTVRPQGGQPVVPGGQRFEVASIRTCTNVVPGAVRATPGRLTLTCIKASFLIQAAYGSRGLASLPPLEGAPSWIDSTRLDVQATAPGNPPVDVMYAMLQPLLEERFKLKVRRETHDVPVYVLTVRSGGAKLRAFTEGTCLSGSQPTIVGSGNTPTKFPCSVRVVSQNGPNAVLQVLGATVDEFSKLLTIDRPVMNRTGIAGRFDFRLEFAGNETTPGVPRTADPSAGPSIFTAIQEQLGLRLASGRGPGDVLVIEHVERPSEN